MAVAYALHIGLPLPHPREHRCIHTYTPDRSNLWLISSALSTHLIVDFNLHTHNTAQQRTAQLGSDGTQANIIFVYANCI